MDKYLFQDESKKMRVQMLEDNCDGIEEISYSKPFSELETVEHKNQLAQETIELDIEETKLDEIKAQFRERMKPMKLRIKELLSHIKFKSRVVKEKVYKMSDHKEGKIGLYNEDGMLVQERTMLPDERQLTISVNKTGTDNE